MGGESKKPPQSAADQNVLRVLGVETDKKKPAASQPPPDQIGASTFVPKSPAPATPPPAVLYQPLPSIWQSLPRILLCLIAGFSALVIVAGTVLTPIRNAKLNGEEMAIEANGSMTDLLKFRNKRQRGEDADFYGQCTAAVCLTVAIAGLASSAKGR